MNLVIIACLILVANYVLTFIQIKNYRKSTEKLINKYRGEKDYYLFSGQSRRALKPGSIVMMIVDKDYIVKECQVMRGVSILSDFKELDTYKGMHAGVILAQLHEKYNERKIKKNKIPAMNVALMTAAENALLTVAKKNASV